VCAPGYVAGADFYDERIGGGVALSCPQSETAQTALWSIFLLALAFRAGTHAVAFAAVLSGLGAKHKASALALLAHMRRSMPLRVVLLDGLVATPLLVAATVLKLATPVTAVLGTDVAVTMLYMLGIFLISVVYADFMVGEFTVLTNSRLMTKGASSEFSSLLRKYVGLSALTTALYLVVVVAPTLAMLGLDHSQGPEQNGESVLLVVRNVGVVLWLFSYLLVVSYLQRELKHLVSTSSSGGGGGGGGGGASSQSRSAAVQQVLAHLHQAQRNVAVQVFVAAIVYGAFCAPVLWPFQQFQLTLMVAIGLHGSNASLVILKTLRASRNAQHSNQVLSTRAGLTEDPAVSPRASGMLHGAERRVHELEPQVNSVAGSNAE